MKLSDVRTWPVARGKAELIKHLRGDELTLRQILLAQCYSCCLGFVDGKHDCEIADCPAYQVMPYRVKKMDRKKRTVSDEQKKAASERMRHASFRRGARIED